MATSLVQAGSNHAALPANLIGHRATNSLLRGDGWRDGAQYPWTLRGRFTKPEFAWDSVVLAADSYGDPMLRGVQTQFIDRVSFDETGGKGLAVRIYARHGRVTLHPDYEGPLPEPKVSGYEIDFQLDGEAFRVTRETASAARLFGVR